MITSNPMEPTQIFLDTLWRSMESDGSKAMGIWATYIAYRIWLARNRGLFEKVWQSMRITLVRALLQAIEIVCWSSTTSTLAT